MSQSPSLLVSRVPSCAPLSRWCYPPLSRLRPAFLSALVALSSMTSWAVWGAQTGQPSKVERLPGAQQPMHVGPPPVSQFGPHVATLPGFKGGQQLCPPYPLNMSGQPSSVTYSGPAGASTSVPWSVRTSGVPAGAKLTSTGWVIRLASNPNQEILKQPAPLVMVVNEAQSLLPTPANPHPAPPCTGAPSSGNVSENLTLTAGQLQSLQTTYGFQALQNLVLWRDFNYVDSQGFLHPVQVSNRFSIVSPPPIH